MSKKSQKEDKSEKSSNPKYPLFLLNYALIGTETASNAALRVLFHLGANIFHYLALVNAQRERKLGI